MPYCSLGDGLVTVSLPPGWTWHPERPNRAVMDWGDHPGLQARVTVTTHDDLPAVREGILDRYLLAQDGIDMAESKVGPDDPAFRFVRLGRPSGRLEIVLRLVRPCPPRHIRVVGIVLSSAAEVPPAVMEQAEAVLTEMLEAARFASEPNAWDGVAPGAGLRLIAPFDGAVNLRLPESWILGAADENESAGMVADDPESGASVWISQSVLDLPAAGLDAFGNRMAEMLADKDDLRHVIEDGRHVMSYGFDDIDDEGPLRVQDWRILEAKGQSLMVATFSLVMPAEIADTAQGQAVLAVLARECPKAVLVLPRP